MSLDRTSPDSRMNPKRSADIVEKAWIRISNIVRIAAGGYRCGFRACILGVWCQAFGGRFQVSGFRFKVKSIAQSA